MNTTPHRPSRHSRIRTIAGGVLRLILLSIAISLFIEDTLLWSLAATAFIGAWTSYRLAYPGA
jgi:hypothetical protein